MKPACVDLRRVILLFTVAFVASCGPLTRGPAVPEALAGEATVFNKPAIRSWGDELSVPFRDELLQAAKRQRVELDARPDPTAPAPSYFLALSGGAADGAFGAGILCGWSVAGTRPEFSVVTGVSTGALIAPLAFLGASYDDKLRELYTTVRTRDIANQRFILTGLLGDSLMDITPLSRKIDEIVDEQMMRDIAREYARGRVLVIATSNADSDRGVVWNIGAIAASGHPDSLKLIRDLLIASAAIPAVFPPVMIDVEADGRHYQEMHVDGATQSQVFLYPPSLMLRLESEMRGARRERTAYVIRNGRLDPQWSEVSRRTIPIAVWAISSLIRANGLGDLLRIYFITKRDSVDFNLAFIPSTFRAEPAELFDPVYMTALFDYGFAAATAPGGFPWHKVPPGWISNRTEYAEP